MNVPRGIENLPSPRWHFKDTRQRGVRDVCVCSVPRGRWSPLDAWCACALALVCTCESMRARKSGTYCEGRVLQRAWSLPPKVETMSLLLETGWAFVTTVCNVVWQKWHSVTSETVIKDDTTPPGAHSLPIPSPLHSPPAPRSPWGAPPPDREKPPGGAPVNGLLCAPSQHRVLTASRESEEARRTNLVPLVTSWQVCDRSQGRTI